MIDKSKENQTKLALMFFMSAYLLDCICAFMKFPGMSWDENSALSVYIVCQNICLSIYKRFYSVIYDFSWEPLFNLFHGKGFPKLTKEAKSVIKSIGD